MVCHTLTDILQPRDGQEETLRWRANVPIGTNPFLLLDLCQISLLGATLVAGILLCGILFTEGGLAPGDLSAVFSFAGLVFAGCVIGFLFISFAFFQNRFFVLYSLNERGVYNEGNKGKDQETAFFPLRLRPCPVKGEVSAQRTKSRHLAWERIDNFQDFPSMRVLHLKRGRWHILRLYTPDAATHDQVRDALARRLRAV